MPSQFLGDVSPKSYASGMQTPENLENITMPSFGGVSGASQRQESSLPCGCLQDESAPSFASNMSRSRSQRSILSQNAAVSGASKGRTPNRQQTLPSQNISGISAPTFGSSGRGTSSNQRIEDTSMPSFGNLSRVSRARTSGSRQQMMPSQNISDISAPSFGSNGQGAMTSECLDQMTMPSGYDANDSSRRMPGRSLSQGASPRRQQNYSGPGRGNMTNECLTNVSMPSGLQSCGYDQTMPSEYLDNETAPSFGNSCPQYCSQQMSRGGQKSSMRRTRFAFSECLNDVSAPNFNSTMTSYQQQTVQMPSECLADESMPSMAPMQSYSPLRSVHSLPSISQQQIYDISAPSMQGANLSYPDSRNMQNTGEYSYPAQGYGACPQGQSWPHLLWADETNYSGNIDQMTPPSLYPNSQVSENDQRCACPGNKSGNMISESANRTGNSTPESGKRSGISSPGSTVTPKTGKSKKGAKLTKSAKGKVASSMSDTSLKKGKGKASANAAMSNRVSPQISNMENINDISMPNMDSMEQSAEGNQSIPNNTNNNNISDISEPSFGSASLQTTNDSGNATPQPVRGQTTGTRKTGEKGECKCVKKQSR